MLAFLNFTCLSQRSALVESLNHRMVWVGRDLQRSSSAAHCHRQGHLSLDQVTQRRIQPDLKHFQWQGIHNFSRHPVPVYDHSHCKKNLPRSQYKSMLFQFKNFALWSVTRSLKPINLCSFSLKMLRFDLSPEALLSKKYSVFLRRPLCMLKSARSSWSLLQGWTESPNHRITKW